MSRGSLVFAGAAALLTGLLLGHERLPGAYGALAAAAAPWLGVLVLVLAVTAILCRCVAGAVATLIPLLVWAQLFGSWWAPAPPAPATPGASTVCIVSQNLFAANGSPAATARELVATGADLVAVQELAGANHDPVRRTLDAAYPHRGELGTVALWSRYPITDLTPADVGLTWHRALRARITTPAGELVVYVVHLPSIRPWDAASRNHGLRALSHQLTDDPAPRVVVTGDFNTPRTDRSWRAFAPTYRHALDESGTGARFTWPAAFPLVRLDHVLVRGVTVTAAEVVRVHGPDHRAVTATLALEP
ncbi:endonuclease/exonuclease/phosphatase family protein [Nocardia sp. NPDC003693]